MYKEKEKTKQKYIMSEKYRGTSDELRNETIGCTFKNDVKQKYENALPSWSLMTQ